MRNTKTRSIFDSDRLSTRFLMTLLFGFLSVTSLFAQSTSVERADINAPQSSDAIANVLQNAKKTGCLVDATIEMSVPLDATVLEHVQMSGQIESVYVTSMTSLWKGALLATPNAPIKSLADAVRNYEQVYRESGPGNGYALFVLTSFTIRGSASDVSHVPDSLPGAKFVSVKETETEITTSASYNKPLLKSPSENNTSSAAAGTPFAPSNAQLTVQTLSNSDRRIDVNFSWNTPAELDGLSDNRSALEIQVLFWNHADDPVANNVSYVGDHIKMWGTNNTILHSYVDTPALNGAGIGGQPTEREVTIGSYDARSDFRAGQQYTVWAIVEKGKLDGNFAKFSVQRGIYKPSPRENFAVYTYCKLHGGSDPASCVAGVDTARLTPTNYSGTYFSIVAPTVPSFVYPTPTCSNPPAYPFLGDGERPSSVAEQPAYDLGFRILKFQRAFAINGGRSSVGCPTNFVHTDSAWWPRGGWTQDFDGSQTGKGAGALMLAPSVGQAFWVHGAIWTRYSSAQFGGPKSVVEEPTGNEQSVTSSRGSNGAYQAFTKGYLYFNTPRNQTYYVVNAIAQKYQSVGLHTDSLGFPISDEYAWNGGARNDFEGGYIYWTATTGAVIVRNQDKVATPNIVPGSGAYSGPVIASILTTTSEATIRYTTNGADPTSSSAIYSSPLTFTSSVTLKARAFKSGMTDSDVASVTYSISTTLKVATPTISPGSGTYSGSVTASISTATSGATIRYTTNGAEPTSTSAIYASPLSFNSSLTLKARAFKTGMTDSDVAGVTYVLQTSTPLSASCTIVPNPITLGTGATVYAQAMGGLSPYRYRINGVDMGIVSSLLVMPSQTGTFTVPLTIFDSQNQQASNSCSAQVVVPDPYITGFNYSPNPAKATQVVSLNIYGGNFNSTTEVWFVGPGCASPGCRTSAVNVSGTAYISAQAVLNIPGTYTVNIRNGSGTWVRVDTVTVVQ